MKDTLKWFVDWTPLVAWLTFICYLLKEVVWPTLPWAKRKGQIIEQLSGDRIRVPWHRIRVEGDKFVIPNYGFAVIRADLLEEAKKADYGFEMDQVTGVKDGQAYYQPLRRYPL